MLSKNNLPNHLPGEKVEKIVHPSFILFFGKILYAVVLLVMPYILFRAFLFVLPSLAEHELVQPLFMLGGSAYFLFIWLFLFFNFIDYFLDIWIITNKRIIDIRQNGLFSRTVSEQHLDKIQDISSEIKGFIHTAFNYGNLYIQTAGEKERVEFNDVPNPERIRDIISKLSEETRREQV